MHVSARAVVVGMAAALLGALTVFAASPPTSTSPVVGKWKMNAAKSKFEQGSGLKSEAHTWEDWGGGLLHAVFEAVTDEGEPLYREVVMRLDGKAYPWVRKGSESLWTLALKPVGPRGWEFTATKDGALYQTGTNTVSEDGRTMTITFKSAPSQARPSSGTMVFDKQ